MGDRAELPGSENKDPAIQNGTLRHNSDTWKFYSCHLLPLNTKNLEGKEALLRPKEPAAYSGKLLSPALEAQGGSVPTHLINPSSWGAKGRNAQGPHCGINWVVLRV